MSIDNPFVTDVLQVKLKRYQLNLEICYARLAQSVEHQTFNLRVAGSSPSSGEQTFYRNVGITRPSIERWVCSFLETNSVSVATNDFQ